MAKSGAQYEREESGWDFGSEDLLEFMEDRYRWFDVGVVENVHGGWDVSLRLDGAYSEKADAEDMAEWFTARLRSAWKNSFDATAPPEVRHVIS